jgi:hypothetical protein
MHFICNFVLGRLISMKDDDLSLNDYWHKYAEAQKGISVLITHFNAEDELGQQLIDLFLFVSKKLMDKPDDKLLADLIEIITITKQGFDRPLNN